MPQIRFVIGVGLAISTITLTACSSAPACNASCRAFIANYSRVIVEREVKAIRVEREATLRMRTNQLGGAAIRGNGFVHVLDVQGKCTALNESADRWSQTHNSFAGMDFSDFISVMGEWDNSCQMPLNFEIKEVVKNSNSDGLVVLNSQKMNNARWERYCNYGTQMNENDFIYAEKHHYDYQNDGYFSTCNKPEFSYTEYLSAWDKFCNILQMTDKEQKIVKMTVRPKKLYKTCKALNNINSYTK